VRFSLLLLKKKDPKGVFWPRLTKDKTRLHWLQTDFDHWKDEDESDDEKAGPNGNFQDMFSGMGGMGGMGGMPDMDMGEGSDEEEDDLDEEGSPMTSENGEKAKNDQESKKTTDESVSKPKTGEQESVSKEQSS